jgi:hypothetical protein
VALRVIEQVFYSIEEFGSDVIDGHRLCGVCGIACTCSKAHTAEARPA